MGDWRGGSAGFADVLHLGFVIRNVLSFGDGYHLVVVVGVEGALAVLGGLAADEEFL